MNFKCVKKEQEFEEGLQSGFAVITSKNSAYVTYEIFMAWMKDRSLPRRPNGKFLLLLMDIHHTPVTLRFWISQKKTT
jgi:hypothetical protein